MVTLKNTAPSPRGVYSLAGLVMFAPGETRTVEISAGERENLASYFEEVAGDAAHPLDHDRDGAPGGSLPADERGLDELRSEAKALGIKVDRRWGEARIRAEIDKANAS